MSSRTQDTEISAMVADQAQRFFGDFVTKEVLTNADEGTWQATLWQEVVETGFPLAYVPEELGGIGLPAADAFALVRLAAYHALPLPLGETLLARAVWQAVQGEDWEEPESAAPWTLSVDPENRLNLSRRGNGWAISGTATCVPWGYEARMLIGSATDEAGLGYVVLLPIDGNGEAVRSNLANEPRSEYRFEALEVSEAQVRPAPPFIARHGLKHYGAFMRSQQMVGAMERALEYALDYAQARVQFGRPIAKMPAVQALLVHAAAQTAAAGAATELATAHFEASLSANADEHFAFAAASAKTRVGEATGEVAAACHQVHAAMGFTQEHPLHFFTRRLWSWRDEAGSEGYWQKRIGEEVCAKGGDALWHYLTTL